MRGGIRQYCRESQLRPAFQTAACVNWWRRSAFEVDRLWAGSWFASLGARWLQKTLFAFFLLLSLGILTAGIYAQWGVCLVLVMAAFGLLCPVLGTMFLPLLCLFSPRFSCIGWGEEVLFFRLDHGVMMGALIRLFLTRRLHGDRVQGALLVLCSLFCISAMAGVLRGHIASPEATLLYLSQWVHLGCFYIVARATASRMGKWGVYAWSLPVLAAAFYGLTEYVLPLQSGLGMGYRCFERFFFDGQANHFAGLFVLGTAWGLGLFSTRDEGGRWCTLGVLLILLCSAALCTTGSRTGLAAWMGAVYALLLFRFPRAWWSIPLVLLGIVALGPDVWAQISQPGSSFFDRLIAWKSALSTVKDFPFLGLGIGARHRSFYDNQYMMVLAEGGVLGLVALLSTLALLGRALGQAAQRSGTRGCFAWGAWGAWVGVLIHALATSSLMVSVVAGPAFWLWGYVLSTESDHAE